MIIVGESTVSLGSGKSFKDGEYEYDTRTNGTRETIYLINDFNDTTDWQGINLFCIKERKK